VSNRAGAAEANTRSRLTSEKGAGSRKKREGRQIGTWGTEPLPEMNRGGNQAEKISLIFEAS